MKRWCLGLGVLAAAVGLAVGAAPVGAQGRPGDFASEQVKHVRTVELDHHANGGRLVGRYFYVTTGADLVIFDVSDPENPRQLGQMNLEPVPIDATYPTGYQEDPDTNGKILLRATGTLQVIDVTDPTAPKQIGQLAGISEHTISCVLDCTWAYGSEGDIIDLRDPKNPVRAGNWTSEVGITDSHDVTEVAPGLVLTASNPMLLLDARTSPANPTVRASSEAPGFVHGTQWPRAMTDDFALAGGEALGPSCDDNPSATFHTWDTRGWQASGTFRLIDQWRLQPGSPPQGRAPDSTWCTHWFDAHPSFQNGGLVAIAWYEQGTRFLRVSPEGKIEEVGWFLPGGGSTWAAYWINDRIVYATDHLRGIDILRWTGEVPATTAQPPGGASAAGSPGGSGPGTRGANAQRGRKRTRSLEDLVRLPSNRRCARSRTFVLRVRRDAADPVQRLAGRVGSRRLRVTGRRLARPIRVRSLPRRRFTLTVEATTRSGERITGRRAYRPCGKRGGGRAGRARLRV